LQRDKEPILLLEPISSPTTILDGTELQEEETLLCVIVAPLLQGVVAAVMIAMLVTT
jgi:hypothetical protein